MSDLRPDTPSVVERTKPVEAGAAVVGVHFLGSTAVFVLAEEALLLVPPQGDVASRRGSRRRHPGCGLGRRPHHHRRRRRQGGGDRRKRHQYRDRKRCQTPLDRSCCDRPQRRAGLVGRQAGIRARRQRSRAQPSKRPRPSAGSRSCRKVFGWRSRTTTAPRSGSRMPRRRRNRSSGRARIAASP